MKKRHIMACEGLKSKIIENGARFFALNLKKPLCPIKMEYKKLAA